MAGVNEELIIRIVPELDKGAVKSVQDQLNAISPKVPIGSAGGGAGGSVVADLKAQQAEMKKVFDGIQQRLIQEDILFRTTRIRLQREIEGIRQQGAQGKITNDQMLQGVAKLESEMVSAADNARNAYQGLAEEIGRTASQFKDVEGVLQSLQAVDKELSVRVVPELDKAAIKSVEDQISAIKPKAPIAVPVSVGGVADMKAQQVEMKKVFDGIQQRLIQEDILLRTTRMRIQREIELTRQQAAQGKITNEQMIQSIAMFEAEAVDAANNARIAYDGLNEELGYTASQFQDVDGVLKQTNRVQTKLLVNTGHLDTGFVTMATSLDKITSQTKNSSLAFMNFGRIIQDAPFGLIGIANNIDPMLNSFSALSNEIDVTTGRMRGFGGAMKALGSQLFGPAGLIFLLGSALPSALLVLQSRQREASKEADFLADALKRVADEFGRLSATAASKRGLSQINSELEVTTRTLDIVSQELSKLEDQINQEAQIAVSDQLVQSLKDYKKELEDQNKELLFRLRTEKLSLESNKENLEGERQNIQAQEVINRLKEQGRVAASLSLEEQYKRRKELTDLEIESLRITDKAQAELLSKQEELRWRMVDLIKDTTIIQTAEGRHLFQALRDEFFSLEKETISSTSGFIDRTLKQQALLSIAYQNNLYLAEDENLTYEQRQKYFDTAINQKRNELELQRQSLQEQLKLTTDEQAQIGIEVQLINLGQESVELNRQAAQFAQKRADAVFQEWLTRQQNISAMEEEIRIMEQRSLDEVLPIDDDTDNLSLRLDLARDEIDRETNYRIEQAIRAGDRIMALDIEKNAFLQAKYQEYLNARYSEEEAMARAIAERNKEFANAEKDVRMEAATEIFQATGELASAAATAIFGDSKGVAIAQVVIDTAMGIQKIWAQSGINPVVGALASAALAAKGITAISKIRQAKPGSGNVSSDSGTPFVREAMYQGVGPNTGQLISTNADQSAAMASPNQMGSREGVTIQANVDRRGLAIAVREGEQEIRTEQFAYV
jgi:hypothetical protein